MREPTTKNSVVSFLENLGRLSTETTQVYLTGGACAVLYGWRETTMDIDLTIYPESTDLLRHIPTLKETLHLNVEITSPSDFIPELPGWRDRSIFIGQYGMVSAYHYDPYSQALSKIERGHSKDIKDVQAMFANGLINKELLLDLFRQIEPELYRYPAIDPESFRAAVAIFVDKK